jgi:hypothetical protein
MIAEVARAQATRSFCTAAKEPVGRDAGYGVCSGSGHVPPLRNELLS